MQLIESLYIHFPFCKHLCNYCDFYKSIPQDFGQDLKRFHQLFENEWIQHQKLLEEKTLAFAPLKTLYIGGGTPSLWKEDGALFLKNFFQTHNLSLNSDAEFTMEVNPATWTSESIEAWRKVGVNRFSLGVQSFNQDFIKILDRVHDLEEVKKSLSYFSSLKANFSVDLMLGLPHSQEWKRNLKEELDRLLEYGPSHFSVYILTVKPQYKHFSFLPNEEYIEEEYLFVAEYLKSQGFLHYEVSNYGLPGKESRHNLQYWKGASVAALGPSATGYFDLGETAFRYKWKTSDEKFEAEILGKKELDLEKIYLHLRASLGLKKSTLSAAQDSLFQDWIRQGLAQEKLGVYSLTSKGYLLLDSLVLKLQ